MLEERVKLMRFFVSIVVESKVLLPLLPRKERKKEGREKKKGRKEGRKRKSPKVGWLISWYKSRLHGINNNKEHR